MADYNDLFIRDSLDDPGVIPSPSNTPYYSPDIIPHPQVVDPATFFTANYSQDVGRNIEYGQYNYIYVRAKNLASAARSATMKVYWSETSLVLTPNSWKNNLLSLANGTSQVTLPQAGPNAVSVGLQPFAWSPVSDNRYGYCMIGRAITPEHPNDIPTGAFDWGGFVRWVRYHPGICWRNLHTVNNHPDPQYDKLHLFSNETSAPTPIAFRTDLTNFPVGTVIRHLCEPVGIDQSYTTTPTINYLYSGATVPAGFSGSLQVMVTLPTGQSWPANGQVKTTCYVGIDEENDVYDLMEFADSWDRHGVTPLELGLTASGRLVEVGNNTIWFR